MEKNKGRAIIDEQPEENDEQEIQAVVGYALLDNGTVAMLPEVVVEGEKYSFPQELYYDMSKEIDEVNNKTRIYPHVVEIIKELLENS